MLSVASVRAQAECLLGRLRHVGRGAGAASKRRGFAVREEEIWARERQAQEVGRRQGRRVVRQGMFLLSLVRTNPGHGHEHLQHWVHGAQYST